MTTIKLRNASKKSAATLLGEVAHQIVSKFSSFWRITFTDMFVLDCKKNQAQGAPS
jgi:hypothetical protein